MNVDDLVRRSKEGLVTKAEVAEVVRLLKTQDDNEHAYRLLYVVGRTMSTEHENLVAGYLDAKEHPSLAGLAVQILCSFWDLSDRYIEHVRRFVKGVEWDFLGDVRVTAITAAGEYLNTRTDCSLLRDLLALCEPDPESQVEQRVALEAVARALGDPLSETLRAGGARREAWAQDVLARGRARLMLECA